MRLHPATFAHGSFAFNAHRNADGTANAANAQNTVIIDRRRWVPSFREGRDAYHLATGGSLGRAHKGIAQLLLWGRIIVPTATQVASLADKESAMLAAFDPDLCYRDSPTTDGAYAFDFSEPTTDTTTYPAGYIPLRYYLRPMGPPSIDEDGDQARRLFALGLLAADPRRYEQSEQTLALNAGTPSGNVVNRGTVPAPLKVTLAMTGAGVSNFTITRAGVAFVLNLSGMVNGDTVVVVMETCAPYGEGRKITKNGAAAFSLKTSSPSTWLDAPVGTTSFSISDGTGIGSCTFAWRSARA